MEQSRNKCPEAVMDAQSIERQRIGERKKSKRAQESRSQRVGQRERGVTMKNGGS